MNSIRNLYMMVIISTLMVGCMQENKENKEKTNESEPMKITRETFGIVDASEVYLFTMSNNSGMTVKVTNYGGIVTSILTPGRDGTTADVVLGFDDLQSYLDGHPYFGSIVGRYGNRIAKGKFTIDGTEYSLATNNGPNHLHGGIKGFDKVVWEAKTKSYPDSAMVVLKYNSPDMEEGYPGNLKIRIAYILTNENELKIRYQAKTDKATPVNLTHHSYFNLGGSQDNALGHILTIAADKYVAVDENLIPTGELKAVAGTPMDFTSPHSIGERIDEVEGGYDHTYVLNNKGSMLKVADAWDQASGRFMEVFTTEPGIQFYSGNFLDGSLTGKGGIIYNKHHGFCLETQHFPDSPNHPEFPNTILQPGEEYGYTTIYKFSTK
ncbi:MAG TPA: aldose epimerase family protein [Bacteroidales bacterium]|nr:aldose epimerase family protein [Bacteroidales bacterium]